jgi:hypothetical protein
MNRELYQNVHPELDCAECGGAGFVGNGPSVELCRHCMGTGVLTADTSMLPLRRPTCRVKSFYKDAKVPQRGAK